MITDTTSSPLLALPMLLVCSWLLQRRIVSIGRISLVMSSLAAATLLAGGIATLLFHQKPAMVLAPFAAGDFGYPLLLLGLFFIIIFLHSHILVILLILAMAATTFARAKVVGTAAQTG